MNTTKVAIYTRTNQGILSRQSVDPAAMTEQDYIDYYALGEATDVEKLTGWPETRIIWYGKTGIGY